MEGRLIRFYIILNKRYIVPMTAKILHSFKKRNADMKHPKPSHYVITPETLEKWGIFEEKCQYLKDEIADDFDVVSFMKSKAKNEVDPSKIRLTKMSKAQLKQEEATGNKLESSREATEDSKLEPGNESTECKSELKEKMEAKPETETK
uniref:Uncharacterized protein n=1 Tax=Acrobeloides nanus TaxID=290746 RepID=A0A914E7B7_9BILA